MTQLDLDYVQSLIDYKFDNPSLLKQAFTRKSYTEENEGFNNEVLEFIGDRALEITITRILVDIYCDYAIEEENKDNIYLHSELNEGQLTEIKKYIVKKETLSSAIISLNLQDYLIMGKGDIKEHRENDASVQEDLFEAIIGAVAIDSNWNEEVLYDVIDTMLDINQLIQNEKEDLDYVKLFTEWYQKATDKKPNFIYGLTSDDDCINGFTCSITIKELNKEFKFVGHSKAEARKLVCEYAYKTITTAGLIADNFEELIINANKDAALKIINQLQQKKLIPEPKYTFKESHDENGNPIWTCTMEIPSFKFKNCFSGSSQKEAKKEAVYDFITVSRKKYN